MRAVFTLFVAFYQLIGVQFIITVTFGLLGKEFLAEPEIHLLQMDN